MTDNHIKMYEEHVLFVSNQIYYWVIKCTTCYHYTNIIKSRLINLIKIGNVFTTEIKSVARDSWRLKPILKYLKHLQNISFLINGLSDTFYAWVYASQHSA